MEIYYIQVNVLCLCVLFVVAVLMRNKRENAPALRRAFLSLISTTAIICVSDTFSWLCNGRSGNGYYFILVASNILYDGAITAACYIWLNYVNLRIGGLEKYSRRFRLNSAIPMAVMFILLIATPFTDFIFRIEAGNTYARGSGIILHWIISWGYLFLASGIVLRRYFTSDSVIEKRQLIPLLWFIIPPIIAAVLQMFFYGITTMQCGMTLSIVIIAVTSLQEKIYTDGLTEMNNRNAFDNYVSEKVIRSNECLTLLMCDIDRFKTINDTLGHVVGDIVLKRIALILKSVCAESSARLFLCRFGGDEFIICSPNADDEEVERIKASISQKLVELNQQYPIRITLGVSIGCAKGICSSSKEVEALIREADGQMYAAKRANAVERR